MHSREQLVELEDLEFMVVFGHQSATEGALPDLLGAEGDAHLSKEDLYPIFEGGRNSVYVEIEVDKLSLLRISALGRSQDEQDEFGN
jgi:hypothetical protein